MSLTAVASMRERQIVPAALAVGMFVLLCLQFWPFTADDAWIVARYAHNAATHSALVYNPGEPVSALTSPLHGLIAAGVALLGLDPVGVWRLAGPLLALGGVLILAARLDGMARAIFLAIAATSPFLALWSVGGLETPMLAGMLAAAAALAHDLGRQSAPRKAGLLLFLCALIVLTRHDALLFVAPLGLAVLWRYRASPCAWAGALAGGGLLGAWLLYAQLAYGTPLPSSFYAKAGLASGGALFANLAYIAGFGVLALGPVLLRRARIEAAPGSFRRMLLLGLLCLAPYLATMATAHMMFGYRALVPYLPVAAALLAPGIAAAGAGLRTAMAAAGANILLTLVMSVHTLNPTVFHLLLRNDGNTSALEAALAREYAFVSLRDYAGFLAVLREQAGAIATDWAADPRAAARPPRILTIAGGVTAARLPEAHVMEFLVSYRTGCMTSAMDLGTLWRSADYIQTYRWRSGPLFPPMRPEDGEKVLALPVLSDAAMDFEQELQPGAFPRADRLTVFRNPSAVPPPEALKVDITAPCTFTPG
ncbi:hypothetical protein [Futiania mangrovi]|uniref:Glycosyltransferase RgtA/B/C/D-like domain-containing protein n=1 Tax=Futiania mangrovi TaxID=2959716 RepID=A0A9J6PFZ8_9PROT|nr:hypothetical protein [Futiania mangrovii]MCP1335034.1 hypothetical protein [Futiania mangrovii]